MSIESHMYVVRQAAPIQNKVEEMMRLAQFPAELDGSDGAYGNKKYSAWRETAPRHNRAMWGGRGWFEEACVTQGLYGEGAWRGLWGWGLWGRGLQQAYRRGCEGDVHLWQPR